MKKNKKNESKTDQIIRLVLTVVFFFIASLVTSGTWQVIFYILALIMLLTSISGYCPCYKVCKINTNKKNDPMGKDKIDEISKETIEEVEKDDQNTNAKDIDNEIQDSSQVEESNVSSEEETKE